MVPLNFVLVVFFHTHKRIVFASAIGLSRDALIGQGFYERRQTDSTDRLNPCFLI